MDWLTFIAKLAEVLAWPTVALVVVSLMRKELRGLFAILKRLKAGPVEAEFEREVKELKTAAEAELPPPTQIEIASPEQTKLMQLAQLDPRLAIIDSWREVEIATRNALSRADVSLSSRESTSPLALSKALTRYELLSPEEISLFNELRVLRNRAVHADKFSLSFESALGYIDVANRIRSALESRSKRDPDS